MAEDSGALQAVTLLRELYEQVDRISCKIDRAERGRPTSARGVAVSHRQQSDLRRELYEVHRLIDGIHRRFPETRTPRRQEHAHSASRA